MVDAAENMAVRPTVSEIACVVDVPFATESVKVNVSEIVWVDEPPVVVAVKTILFVSGP